jgi:peptidyl-prolyl cis-trans isomerase B (cyclophilin B)
MRMILVLAALMLAAAPASAGAPLVNRARPKRPDSTTAAMELKPPTAAEVAAAKKQGKVKVKIETAKGAIEVELDGKAAPLTVANFLNLVKAGFYNGIPFHRVEPGFVIQAGDPAAVGRPPVGFTIPDEKSPVKHTKGTIAMARTYRGGQMVPNSGSTQFYITLADTPHLDAIGFTAFGKVVSGMDVVQKIAVGDKIVKAGVVGKRRG